ncbi:MAG: DUF3450 family protein [Acidobacteriota bacterium]
MKSSNVVWAAALCASALLVWAQEPSSTPEEIEATRGSISKWIGTQTIIGKERKDWQQGKELLRARIELVGKEIEELQAKLAETRGKVAEAAAKRAEVSGQVGRAKDVGNQLAQRVAGLEADVKRFYKVLPPYVQEKVDPLYTRMPEAGREDRVSIAERFQNVLGILNEINKANSEITLVSEIRPLDGGKPSEVQTVYFGLAQAYFLSAKGEAGIGRPTADGWTWQTTTASNDIQQMIEILQNKHVPTFVALPVAIQ